MHVAISNPLHVVEWHPRAYFASTRQPLQDSDLAPQTHLLGTPPKTQILLHNPTSFPAPDNPTKTQILFHNPISFPAPSIFSSTPPSLLPSISAGSLTMCVLYSIRPWSKGEKGEQTPVLSPHITCIPSGGAN